MPCNEYQMLEIAWRIAASSARAAYRSGTPKRTELGDTAAAAEERRRLETEMERHRTSCETCRNAGPSMQHFS